MRKGMYLFNKDYTRAIAESFLPGGYECYLVTMSHPNGGTDILTLLNMGTAETYLGALKWMNNEPVGLLT